MINDIGSLKLGLVLSMLTLIFGISMGILFGANEDRVQDYISDGIATHQSLHDAKSQSKIWRYAQRAHFHATGVSAFALVLILITASTALTRRGKFIASTLVGFGSFYPLSWFSMFLLSPSMGREGAHHAFVTESITMISVACLSIGIAMVMYGLLTSRSRGVERSIGNTSSPGRVLS
jgi:hypothetical protein